jgi:IclR family pca regulon transcriptional regulator
MRTVEWAVDMAAQPHPSDRINSLARGLSVVGVFSADTPQLTLSQVAAAVGLARATARRILLTLVELGFVEQEGRNFSLLPKVLDLGYAYLSALRLPDLAEPYMEKLVEEVRESSSISLLDGKDIVYVARVPTSRIMTVSLAVGSRLPAYATSMGRVLLAGVPEGELDNYLSSTELIALTSRTITDQKKLRAIILRVRQQGYAVVDQELEDGVRSVAAPIVGAKGKVVAALNISCHASRTDLARIRSYFLPKVIETARQIGLAARSLTSL